MSTHAALARTDPTKTRTLRRRAYKPALTKRIWAVNGAVRDTTVSNDAFHITDSALAPDDASSRQSFPRRATDQIEAFEQWFQRAIRTAVLEPTSTRAIRNGDHYTAPFVEEAYRRGVKTAAQSAKQAGEPVPTTAAGAIALSSLISADALARLYRRNYNAVEGVVTATERRVAEVGSREIPPATNKQALAAALIAPLTAVGIKRAVDLAHTEVVFAVNEAILDVGEQLGASGVTADVELELQTAGDSRVCAQCRALDGERYSLSEARGMLPLHPRGRCRWTLMF